MKNKYLISLNNINNLRQFQSDILYKIKSDVDAIFERQTIDAKSLLGLISISVHNITVLIHSEDTKELETFEHICRKYEVE